MCSCMAWVHRACHCMKGVPEMRSPTARTPSTPSPLSPLVSTDLCRTFARAAFLHPISSSLRDAVGALAMAPSPITLSRVWFHGRLHS